MRLLQIEGPVEPPTLTEVHGLLIPPYAVLSHTWGRDEVTYEEINEPRGREKEGYQKILFCQRRAYEDGLKFFWVDTCCIDQTSNSELSEAINSMFQWYQEAVKCYVYLEDVTSTGSTRSKRDWGTAFGTAEGTEPTWRTEFRASRWFRRGWTLQELLAPMDVEFYSSQGALLGDKSSLMEEIYAITNIPLKALQWGPLSDFTVEERMSWASGRETRRAEDAAYSLLGLFSVYMPIIYEEGRKRAFDRLKRERYIKLWGQMHCQLIHPLMLRFQRYS